MSYGHRAAVYFGLRDDDEVAAELDANPRAVDYLMFVVCLVAIVAAPAIVWVLLSDRSFSTDFARTAWDVFRFIALIALAAPVVGWVKRRVRPDDR